MRALSGIQATGGTTLGNYLGAIKRWAADQGKYDENFYFIPDLHTLTVRQSPKELNDATYSTTAWLLTAGIDPKKSTIYLQSQIPAHSELFWILNNYVTMGELSRMTQYKEKSSKRDPSGQIAGLFTYPVLMAADILLYDADVVPTGEDQLQHIEITRDIAARFNKSYGDIFKLPKPDAGKLTARIMDLQDPTKKMSKSEAPDSLGVIQLLDSADDIKKKVSKAVTDSGDSLKSGADKPALTNLINIYAGLSGKIVAEIEQDYGGKGYAEFKKDLADLAVNTIEPLQKKYQDLYADKSALDQVLGTGRQTAERIANKKLAEIKRKVGLLSP